MPGAVPTANTCGIEWTSGQFLAPMAIELDEWLKRAPEAPGVKEAPEGWHKVFDSFTICGEGECIKTLYTIYAPGKPRWDSVDLDKWGKHR
jgi:hypothetical protein